jgi:hypothetical protein
MAGETTIAGLQTEVALDALIGELDAAMGHLPEEALRTCQRHRELVTPRLIDVLAEAVRLGREGTVRAGNAHFFALFLLTEFQAKEALSVVLDAFSLREPALDGVLGGAVTETTRRVLAVLAGDQPDLIESMILNRQLDDYIRWEAALAICCLVRDGRMTRGEALQRLSRQLRSAVEAKDWWGVTIVICELGALNPLEMRNEIKAAFDQHLVDESIVSWRSFEKYLLQPSQAGLCPSLDHWKPSAIADTVAELRAWASFREEDRRESKPPAWSDDLGEEEFGDDFQPLDPFVPPVVTGGTIRNEAPRIGRNDPCPCGSGKKYKKCCLRAERDF